MLKVDWNPINNLIISGGEDCKYKVLKHTGFDLYSTRKKTDMAFIENAEQL